MAHSYSKLPINFQSNTHPGSNSNIQAPIPHLAEGTFHNNKSDILFNVTYFLAPSGPIPENAITNITKLSEVLNSDLMPIKLAIHYMKFINETLCPVIINQNRLTEWGELKNSSLVLNNYVLRKKFEPEHIQFGKISSDNWDITATPFNQGDSASIHIAKKFHSTTAMNTQTYSIYAAKIHTRPEYFDHEFLVLKRISSYPQYENWIIGFQGGFNLAFGSCLVFDYMPQGSLYGYICNNSNYLEIYRDQILTQTTQAVEFLHSTGTIHNDLNSYNILVHFQENCASPVQVKLCDFGISTIEGLLPISNNKFRYLSPECVSTQPEHVCPVTTKADIYSLGLLFWEIFHRKIVFQDLHPTDKAFFDDRLPFLEQVKSGDKSPNIDGDICTQNQSLLMFSMWNFDPQERPTATEVLKKLTM